MSQITIASPDWCLSRFLLSKHKYKPLNNKEANKMIKLIYSQPDCAEEGLLIIAREI